MNSLAKFLLMVIFFLLPVAFNLSPSASAQAPQKMSYQAVIRNSSNALVTSTAVGMQISILQGSSSGSAVYVETHTPTTNANGLVSIEIGAGTVASGTFSAIDWSAGPYYIKTETDPAGGVDYKVTGVSQLLSVPYAQYAESSATSSESATIKQNIKILEDNLISAGTYKLADITGNQYNVVKIGTQVWMKENLKTTKYNDGTSIPNVTADATWEAATTGAYSDYSNTPDNSTTNGRLYNWFVVDNNPSTKVASNGGKNVCPAGWHVPTDAQWTKLTDYLTANGNGYQGSGIDIGKSMAATSGWNTWGTAGTVGNDQATNNSSGFTALAGGFRTNTGPYYYLGEMTYWWCSTENELTSGFTRYMFYNNDRTYNGSSEKKNGFAVRCLRD
jgi:uncharacterized protein (TIGR02145 family)